MNTVTPLARTREMERLRELVASASSGTGKVVLLEGEAGIGKTTILLELHNFASAAGFLSMYGKAEELESRSTLSGLLACIEHEPLAAGLYSNVAKILRQTPQAGPSERPENLAFAAGEAVLEFLSEESVYRPVTMFFDDLQWADQTTLQVLLRVARLAGQLPIVLFLAVRPVPRGPSLRAFLGAIIDRGALTQRLEALPDDSLNEFVEVCTGSAPGPRLVEQLRQCAGNPLFLTVTLDALIRSGTVNVAGGVAEVGSVIPGSTLPVTILQRLRFCSPDTMQLLTFAAVAGRTFAAAELAAAAHRSVADIVPALNEGIEAGMLTERDGTLVFRHDVIRDALYFDLPASVRSEVHLKIAQSLRETRREPSRIAEHLLRSSSAGTVELLHSTAIELLRQAPEVAADLLEGALARAQPSQKDRILPDLSIALILCENPDRGIELCRQCIARELRSTTDESLYFLMANELTAKGELQESLQVAIAGLADPATPAHHRPRLAATHAISRLFLGDLQGAEEVAREMIGAARELGDQVAESRALLTISLVAHLQGRFVEALESSLESVRLAELVDRPEAFHHVPHAIHSACLLDFGRVEESLEFSRRGLKVVESLAAGAATVWMQSVVAHNLFLLGRWSEADVEADAALEIAREAGAGWTCFALAVRAMVAVHRGSVEAAAALGKEMDREMERVGTGSLNGLTIATQACLLSARGEHEEALRKIDDIWHVFSSYGLRAELPNLFHYLAELAFNTGDSKIIADAAAEIGALHSDNPEAGYLHPLAGWGRALSQHDAVLLVESLNALKGTPRRFEWAITAYTSGRALSDWGHSTESTRVLTACLEVFDELGASTYTSRVRSKLRKLGTFSGHRGKRNRPRSGWDSLTDVEMKIVRLVTERLSNPQIANRLVVSTRTVETHVSHCLAKLGLSSRTELAGKASERFGWRFGLQGPGE